MMNDNQNDELLQNEANPDRVFFDYLARSYERYIRGADIEEIENNLFQLCEERAAEIRNDITDLERDIEHTKADIADHENLKKEYQKKLIEHQDLSRDASRFEQALKKLDSIRESHALQLRQTQERALQIESECAVLEKTKHQLIDQIESQDVSIEDYSRMLKEVELMKESLKQLTKEEEQVKSNNWEVDREVYVLIEEIEKKVYEFNEKAAGLQLIPSSAKNAQGKNFKLEFDRSAEPLKSFNLDLKSDLKPALLRLRTKYEEGNRQSLDEKRDIGDRIRKLEEVQQEKSEDIRMNQEKLAKFEQTYEDEYKKFNRITKENISKVEDLELENIKNQNLFSDRLKEAESTLQQLDIE